jgi:hypothetical protein
LKRLAATAKLGTRRQDRDPQGTSDRNHFDAETCEKRDFRPANDDTCLKDGCSWRNILARFSNVRSRFDVESELYETTSMRHVLLHDDCIGATRQRGARHDAMGCARSQYARRISGACAACHWKDQWHVVPVGQANGISVHCRLIEWRETMWGLDCRGQDAPGSASQRHVLRPIERLDDCGGVVPGGIEGHHFHASTKAAPA